MKTHFVSAIIAAAGQGKRMNQNINKQYIKLLEKPILAHTLEVFEKSSFIDEVIVVTHPDELEFCKKEIIYFYRFEKVKKVIAGGAERQNSIYNGLKSVNKKCEIVVIHDGARPFLKEEELLNSIKEATKYKAVGIGVPVKDTIKMVDHDKIIVNTPNRNNLWAIQTPQVFLYDLLMKGHIKAIEDEYIGTDDTVLIERMGQRVKMIMGSYDNIKITTPEDLYIGEAILKRRGKLESRNGI